MGDQAAKFAGLMHLILSPILWPRIMLYLVVPHCIENGQSNVCCVGGVQKWDGSVRSIGESEGEDFLKLFCMSARRT